MYAVGDVHGRADLLDRLLAQIDTHVSRNPVSRPIEVFLGNYIDRGPDARRVIDLLIRRCEKREIICLKGNHETYLLEFLKAPNVLDIWSQCGGLETLLSYGVRPPVRPNPAERKQLARSFAKILPKDHLRFLSRLKMNFACGDFLFVHAGVQPGVPLERQREEHLLWIRDDFLRSDRVFEKYIVHGHTPVKEPDIRPNRVNIDTGAYASGRLTCLIIEGEEMQVIPQDSDDLGEVSNVPLAGATIPQTDFVPAEEFPSQIDNAAAIMALENVATGGSSEPAKDTFARTARSNDEIANLGSTQKDTFTRDELPNDQRTAAAQAAQLIKWEKGQNFSPAARPRLRTFVIPIVVALLALGAASMLIFSIPKPGNNAATDRIRMSSDTGSKDLSADSAPTEQPRHNVEPEPRLILQPNLSGGAGASIPLGARVSDEAPGLALEISGLPDGMTISTGRPLGTGAWRILAAHVADAMINPPPGFGGAIDLKVELRRADDTVIDQASLHREWPQPQAAATGSDAPTAHSADLGTSGAAGPNENAANAAADSQLDHEQIDFLIERGQALISEGDAVSARIQLRRAAEAQDAHAALALGATYDPIMLAILQIHGVPADVSQARYWYQKAKEYGSLEAPQRLKLLENLRP